MVLETLSQYMLRLGWWYQGVGGKASMRFEEKVEVRVKV